MKFKKGLYLLGLNQKDEIGLGINFTYSKLADGMQFTITFLNWTFGIGWQF